MEAWSVREWSPKNTVVTAQLVTNRRVGFFGFIGSAADGDNLSEASSRLVRCAAESRIFFKLYRKGNVTEAARAFRIGAPRDSFLGRSKIRPDRRREAKPLQVFLKKKDFANLKLRGSHCN